MLGDLIASEDDTNHLADALLPPNQETPMALVAALQEFLLLLTDCLLRSEQHRLNRLQLLRVSAIMRAK